MIGFSCNSKTLTKAYEIAVKDAEGNVKEYRDGALKEKARCIMAGEDYDTPWTRDTAINVMNAFALLDPAIAKNTLLSVIERRGGGYIIGGQYWDCIIWAIGAYAYIVATGDNSFIPVAYSAVKNSLAKFEREEYDPTDGLFRGPAVYGDGIAAYPDQYARTGSSGIESWSTFPENRERLAKDGFGIPMKALSTNCVYYRAYEVLAFLCERRGKDPSAALSKAEALKKAINRAFWNEKKGTYDYLAYECDRQEALGISFALLFGVADERQKASVLKNAGTSAHGITCVEPTFKRYSSLGSFGRHSGTVWPHAQGFWALAAYRCGDRKAFEKELFLLAEKAVRDGQFYEIYHPVTGAVYGGLQGYGGKNDIREWRSCAHQTWSATAYLSLIYFVLLGAQIDEGKVTFKPYLPAGVDEAKITGMKIGKTTFNVKIVRKGQGEKEYACDTTAKKTVDLELCAE